MSPKVPDTSLIFSYDVKIQSHTKYLTRLWFRMN